METRATRMVETGTLFPEKGLAVTRPVDAAVSGPRVAGWPWIPPFWRRARTRRVTWTRQFLDCSGRYQVTASDRFGVLARLDDDCAGVATVPVRRFGLYLLTVPWRWLPVLRAARVAVAARPAVRALLVAAAVALFRVR